jgi:DNA replication protein DnaC
MSAFLKIDDCTTCHRSLPWDWVPAVLLNGKTLPGTAVWRSQLVDGCCQGCQTAVEAKRLEEERARILRQNLISLLGGERPYREFTFERYKVMPGNRLAYERSKGFDPSVANLYLWGTSGVGKTHLAWAMARRCFEESLSVAILPAYQLSRNVRMKDPDDEQAALDRFVRAESLVLDDLGVGSNSAYNRQILQEILDGRAFTDRSGLVVTSKYSLDELATTLADDSIPSRLAGMCTVVRIHGSDGRLTMRKSADVTGQ